MKRNNRAWSVGSALAVSFAIQVFTYSNCHADDLSWIYFQIPVSEVLERSDALPLDKLTSVSTAGFIKTTPHVWTRKPCEVRLHQVSAGQQTVVGRYPRGKQFEGVVYQVLIQKDGVWQTPPAGTARTDTTWCESSIQHKSNTSDPQAELLFWRATRDVASGLLRQNYEGASWFRHYQRKALLKLRQLNDAAPLARQSPQRDLLALSMLSGGRAVAENLPLDEDGLNGRTRRSRSQVYVSIADEKGITVAPIDWQPLIKDQKIRKDFTAQFVPHDQHVLFLPDGKAALQLKQEFDRLGSVVLASAQQSTVSTNVWDRYEKQIGIPIDGLARWLVAPLIQQIAVTGGDPYFRTGTDVAIIVASGKPTLLKSMLLARRKAFLGDVAEQTQTIQGLECSVIRDSDRSVSSYVTRIENVVIAANSPEQIRTIAKVHQGQVAALSSLEEYTFFRQRYKKNEPETALALISDDTIRRWCSPKWRIGSARRTWAAAALAQNKMLQVDAAAPSELREMSNIPFPVTPEKIKIVDGTPQHPIYGTLDFLTPISELMIERVSTAERDDYRTWRDNYEGLWRRQRFDPIGIRMVAGASGWESDLTVLPLNRNTDYRWIRQFAMNHRIGDAQIDSHSEALFDVTCAMDKMSLAVALLTWYSKGKPELVQAALGDFASVYFDYDQSWFDEMKADPSRAGTSLLTANPNNLPLALRVGVADQAKFDEFCGHFFDALFFETQNLKRTKESHKGYDLVRLQVSDRKGTLPEAEFWYCVLPDAATFSPNRSVVIRAIERFVVKGNARNEEVDTANDQPNKDVSQAEGPASANDTNKDKHTLVANLTGKGIEMIANLDPSFQLRRSSWSNLPILDWIKHQFPDEDAQLKYTELFNQSLVCPAGGKYRWNDRYRCHESTLFGHPMFARSGPAVPPIVRSTKHVHFGVTFENQGIRSQSSIEFE